LLEKKTIFIKKRFLRIVYVNKMKPIYIKIIKILFWVTLYGFIGYAIYKVARTLMNKVQNNKDLIICTESQKKNNNGDCVSICDGNKIINNSKTSNCEDDCIGDCTPDQLCGCDCIDSNSGIECINNEICPASRYCKLDNPNYVEYGPPTSTSGKNCAYPSSIEFKNGAFAKDKNSAYKQGQKLKVTCDDKYIIKINNTTGEVVTDGPEIDLYCDDGSWNTEAVQCVSTTTTTTPPITNWESPTNLTCCASNESCKNNKCESCPNTVCGEICCKEGETCFTENGVSKCCGADKICGKFCCENCCTDHSDGTSECCPEGTTCHGGKCKVPCGGNYCDGTFEKCVSKSSVAKDSSQSTVSKASDKDCKELGTCDNMCFSKSCETSLPNITPQNIEIESLNTKFKTNNPDIKLIPTCQATDTDKSIYIVNQENAAGAQKTIDVTAVDKCAGFDKKECTGEYKDLCEWKNNKCNSINGKICSDDVCETILNESGLNRINVGDKHFTQANDICSGSYNCEAPRDKGGVLYSYNKIFGSTDGTGGSCPLINPESCCKSSDGTFTGKICVSMDTKKQTCINQDGKYICANGWILNTTGSAVSCKPSTEPLTAAEKGGLYETNDLCIRGVCTDPKNECCSPGFTYNPSKNRCLADIHKNLKGLSVGYEVFLKEFDKNKVTEGTCSSLEHIDRRRFRKDTVTYCGPAYTSNCTVEGSGTQTRHTFVSSCETGSVADPPPINSTVPHYSCNATTRKWDLFDNKSKNKFTAKSEYCAIP
jgi:hypothetical protein